MDYKLKETRPQPTDAERQVLETYSAGKYASKIADGLKEPVMEIIARLGEVPVEHGVLMPSESVSYPLPTLDEWDERIARAEKALATAGEAQPHKDRAERLLERLRIYREELATVHRWQETIKEWTDYFKAAGVVVARKVPTVKFCQVKRGKADLPKPPALPVQTDVA